MWLAPLGDMDPEGEPEAEISAYVRAKLEQSRDHPQESRLFLGEVMQGAPLIAEVLATDLKEIVEEKAGVIRGWIRKGKLAPVDPVHLIFMIWAMTQHYADFDTQIRALLGKGMTDGEVFRSAGDTVLGVLMRGILPR